MDTPSPAVQAQPITEDSSWENTLLATFFSVAICVCISIGGGIFILRCAKRASARKDRSLRNRRELELQDRSEIERSTDESAKLDDGDIEHGTEDSRALDGKGGLRCIKPSPGTFSELQLKIFGP